MGYCLDCGKLTKKKSAVRCWECYCIYRYAHRKIKRCIDCGTEINKHKNTKRCQKCYGITEQGKILSPEHRKTISLMLQQETGSKNRNWKGGFKYCEDCGKQLKSRGTTRCRSCSAKLRVKKGLTSFGQPGGKSCNWKDGKSFEKYSDKWTRAVKREVRWRDGFQCVECGVSEADCGRRLDVHHIDYNKRNVSMINLISLCGHCHRKTNFNRGLWEKYFSEKSINRHVNFGFVISNIYKM